jgi:hypothetical protein
MAEAIASVGREAGAHVEVQGVAEGGGEAHSRAPVLAPRRISPFRHRTMMAQAAQRTNP